jgi:hypothetical protein
VYETSENLEDCGRIVQEQLFWKELIKGGKLQHEGNTSVMGLRPHRD